MSDNNCGLFFHDFDGGVGIAAGDAYHIDT